MSRSDRHAPWILAAAMGAAFFLFPDHRVLASQVMIVALAAISLDLVLGYAGIVSLGHAAFFGLGAYTAGLLAARAGWTEPLTGLAIATLAAATLGFATSFLVVRGTDLTRLMVTMGIGLLLHEAANRAAPITGGVDGLSLPALAVLGQRFDLRGTTAFLYAGTALLVGYLLARRLVASPFGLSLTGIRENPLRMAAIGAPVRARLLAIYTFAAGMAGAAGALLAQTTQFVGLETLGFQRSAELLVLLVVGGTGRLHGALVGAAIFMVVQDRLAGLDPLYWQFWLGLMLVVLVLASRGGVLGALDALVARGTRK